MNNKVISSKDSNIAPAIDVNQENFILGEAVTKSLSYNSPVLLVSLISVLLLPTENAFANEYGIFAGRTASLMHPLTMGLLFGTSLYSGYLGLQWRRLRGLSDEIKTLQKQGPILSNGELAKFPLSDSISKMEEKLRLEDELSDTNDTVLLKNDLIALKNSMELDSKVNNLVATRKKLQNAKLKDKHEMSGSILLGVGVSVAILGAFNTYMRAGKLFPGPHLYAGMACTILWAVAASLSPSMAKGNNTARSAHIALNSINVVLFGWQVVSGIPILLKVIEKTSWP